MTDVQAGTEPELDPTDPYAREGQTFPRLSEEMALRVARYGTEEALKAGDIVNSTSRADTDPLETTSSATEIGNLNRRGPALPGFTKTTPSRCSMTGLCEWPDTTTRTPAPFGSISSCARS